MNQSLKFSSHDHLLQWFRQNSTEIPGIWIRFDTNDTESTLTTDDALRIALSFGWVEDRIKRISEDSFRKKYIPRRDRSPWTDEQKAIVNELTALGKMEKPGISVMIRAKSDGSWSTVQTSPQTDAMLETFTQALQPHEPAFSIFLRLPSSTQRTYASNYCNAKRPETRVRRLKSIITKLTAGTI